jgi:hypothetical protein
MLIRKTGSRTPDETSQDTGGLFEGSIFVETISSASLVTPNAELKSVICFTPSRASDIFKTFRTSWLLDKGFVILESLLQV